MITDNQNEHIKRQVAEFERRTGRVPTIEELAKILEMDPRLLARRLKKSTLQLGMDAQSEGSSAFKASFPELLSSGLMDRGVPSEADLQALLQKARENKTKFATLRWTMGDGEVSLSVQVTEGGAKPLWVLCNLSAGDTEKIDEIQTDQLELVSRMYENLELINPRQEPASNVVPFNP
ncbi:MAG TPA: hypothetical protein EYN91_01105 [Candidatus Melainabacteria bacterium]|nr:hypothetical protein [Candidatus Melainabacteria bacterium]HIN64277.1 hypothetical protein [Candidatus Obscuribacterales bacterium]